MRWSIRACGASLAEPLTTLAVQPPPSPPVAGPQGSPLVLALRRMGRVWSVRASLAILGFCMLLAIYAPFLCSDVALVWHDQHGMSFPVLTALFNQRYFGHWYDLMFNLLALETPGLLLLAAMLRWRLRPLKRWSLVLGIFALSVVASCVPVFSGADGYRALWRERADHSVPFSDYQALSATERVADQVWAVFPPVPHRALQAYDDMALKAPGTYDDITRSHFWLGSDTVGKDVLAILIYGARISLTIGLVASGISLLIGTVFGAISGYCGGTTDLIMQRIVEIVLCLPTFLLIIMAVAVFGRDIFVIMTVIGLTGWGGTARLVRGEFLAQSVRDYVLAGESLGLSRWRLMFRHILPNSLTPLLITATFSIAGAILSESGLSFLGLGDPTVPTWGGLLEQGREAIEYSWLIYAPGLAIFALVTALNILGSEMREALDPKGHS